MTSVQKTKNEWSFTFQIQVVVHTQFCSKLASLPSISEDNFTFLRSETSCQSGGILSVFQGFECVHWYRKPSAVSFNSSLAALLVERPVADPFEEECTAVNGILEN